MAEEVASLVCDQLMALASASTEIGDVPMVFGAHLGDDVPAESIVFGAGEEAGLGEQYEPAALGRSGPGGRAPFHAEFWVMVHILVLAPGRDLRGARDRAIEIGAVIQGFTHQKLNLGEGHPTISHWNVQEARSVPWAADNRNGSRRAIRITGKARVP